MIYLSKETELTTELLQKLINKFTVENLPRLKKWENYYKGRHAILNKSYKDSSKECNHIVTNYCKIITDTYSGYICGKPITYTSNNDIEDIQEAINYNDSNAEDINWLTNALVYGVGYELKWLDKYAQVRYSQVIPTSAFAIYDNTLDCELLYFVRWYKENTLDDSNNYIVEVYSAFEKVKYRSAGLGGALTYIDKEQHYFKDVPVSVFYLNENEENIFNSIITLNDAYNEL